MDALPDFVLTQEFFWGVIVVGIVINLISEIVSRLFSNGYFLLNKKLKANYEIKKAQKDKNVNYYSKSYERLLVLKINCLHTMVFGFIVLAIGAASSLISILFTSPFMKVSLLVFSIFMIYQSIIILRLHVKQFKVGVEAENKISDREDTE